jgi:putative oxidoreductase
MTNRAYKLLIPLNRLTPAALSLFRVVFGLLFLCHGVSKLFGWPAGPIAPVGSWPLFYAGVIEVVCGVLIVVGLFTRGAAFIASGEMAVGYFVVHLPQGLMPLTNGGEMAVVYSFAFLLLFFTGGGMYALDNQLRPHSAPGAAPRTFFPRVGSGRGVATGEEGR